MHEVHSVKNIISIVNEKAKANNLHKVTKINVVLGQLSGITKEGFTYWFDELKKGTPAENAEIVFKELPEPNIYVESIEA